MPAVSNAFLFVEPVDHYIEYGSVVLHDVVEQNRRSGQVITELMGDDANPDRIKQELQRLEPILLCLIAHGNTDVVSAECTVPFVYADSPELELFKDKVISLTSCLTAVSLGPAIIDAGAVAYTGYKEEFWFYIGNPPGSTRAVRSPFIPEFQFVASFLQGKSTGESRRGQLNRYDQEIDYWITGDGKDHADAMELSRILEMNKSNSVFLGESDIIPESPPLTATMSMSLVFGLSFLAVGLLIQKAMKS